MEMMTTMMLARESADSRKEEQRSPLGNDSYCVLGIVAVEVEYDIAGRVVVGVVVGCVLKGTKKRAQLLLTGFAAPKDEPRRTKTKWVVHAMNVVR